jgi:butyrate kinase
MKQVPRRDLVIAVNPGSTSSKIAVYRGRKCLACEGIEHSREELSRFGSLAEQEPFRREVLLDFLAGRGVALARCAAVAGRGGLTKPLPGGVYRVNARMLRDLKSGRWGVHPCNLGAALAADLGRAGGAPAFVVDPPVVDELSPLARYSGHPAICRRSVFHALSQRAAARRAARQLRASYEKNNFIVVHMGGGITIGAHQRGRVVDVNDGLFGEGPFTPERTGSLPAVDVARLCFSGRYSLEELQKTIAGKGGLFAYLGTNDCRIVEEMIRRGDAQAREIYEAMAYQIAKSVGEAAAVLCGRVKAVVFTGGMSRSRMLIRLLRKYVSFIAPLLVYAEMEEMGALALSVQAALAGKIEIQEYC